MTEPRPAPLAIDYQQGTLAIRGESIPSEGWPAGGKPDARDGSLRFEASAYFAVVRWLHSIDAPYDDHARQYEKLNLVPKVQRDPFPHQREAFASWMQAHRRGVVVLPTGAGKSHVAVLAIEATQRSALVVVPTLDLVSQWYGLLSACFDAEIGIVGGGYHEVRDLCVTTYDSAFMHAERLGNRFGLIVFDECHHLPGASYALSARASIAPFRLGLTATLERPDGRHDLLEPAAWPISRLTGWTR